KVEDDVESDGLVEPGDDEHSLEQAFHRLDPLPHRLRIAAEPGKRQPFLIGHRQSPLPGFCSSSVSVWRAKRFPAKPSIRPSTNDQRTGAVIGMNNCASSIRAAACASSA